MELNNRDTQILQKMVTYCYEIETTKRYSFPVGIL